MAKELPPTRAIVITAKNASVLKNISNVKEDAFTSNPGWIFVEDWNESPRFLIMPENIFHQYYPNLEFTVLKVDEDVVLKTFEITTNKGIKTLTGESLSDILIAFQKKYGYTPDSWNVKEVPSA